MVEPDDQASSFSDSDEDGLLEFLTITPQNDDAVRNFSAICAKVLQQPQQPSNVRPGGHHIKFMRYSEAQISLPPNFSSGSDSEVQAERAPSSQDVGPIWKGCYVLTLRDGCLPMHPRDGWYLGSGRWNGTQNLGGVDILLDRGENIGRRHALFQFDTNGKLFFSPRHSGTYFADKELEKGTRYPIPGNCPRLRIGKLVFELRYITSSESERYFQSIKTSYLLKNEIATEIPPVLTSATPSETVETVGKWTFLGVKGTSQKTAIMGAYQNVGGSDAAVKTVIRREKRTAAEVANEVDIYRHLRRIAISSRNRYWHFVMQLEEVIYPDGETWIEGKLDKAHIIWTPLAKETFMPILRGALYTTPEFNHISAEQKQELFAQMLMALTTLHEAGLIHRDIKPSNLLIVKTSPEDLRAVMSDFEQAIPTSPGQRHEPTPKQWGTINYLAPEAENLAYCASGYDATIDVFSMGCVGYELFIKVPPWKASSNIFAAGRLSKIVARQRSTFEMELRQLKQAPDNSMENLLSQMLAPDPSTRLDASHALGHSCLDRAVLRVNERLNDLTMSGSKRDAGHVV